MADITVRKLRFDFSSNPGLEIVPGDARASSFWIGLSLTMPYLEPYLIRTMKAATKQVTDPKILDGLKGFAAQEGQHYRVHMKFNESIRRSGFPGLEALEQELSDDYQRFTKTKSLRFNLAYAEGFEALTKNAIKFIMEPNGLGEDLSPVMQMFEWHFVEELEHRTVAFDVYDHVCGGYFYRLFVGMWAQWHFLNWTRRVTAYMLKVSPAPKRSAAEKAKLERTELEIAPGSVWRLLPKLLRIYLPSYTPHALEVAPGIQVLADKYSEMAIKTS